MFEFNFKKSKSQFNFAKKKQKNCRHTWSKTNHFFYLYNTDFNPTIKSYEFKKKLLIRLLIVFIYSFNFTFEIDFHFTYTMIKTNIFLYTHENAI